ncbi:NDR1/HIN1-like protein 13 [Triticum dicoccoides]|uniref:NDR1/HIN1-like protein 13 n=1 Tax=Triticum dicoccoides TaxID=85692 RepID=UPI000E78AA0F|nr:NDR1/HIN1-like protein 13 [Triticum dicoccoides]
MADRVHPAPLLPLSTPPAPPTDNRDAAAENAPLRSTAAAPGASYVVHVPKDQVLRVPLPPPDRKLAARTARRRMLRRACCGACCALLLLLVLAAAFVGAVYLVLRPRAPSFSVTSLSVAGLLDPSPAQLDAAVRADNGANRKVGVDYRGGGEVSVSYSGVLLATGRWPAFYQAPRNVTLISMPLTGRDGVALTDDQRGRLAEQAAAGAVPLTVEARVPVRVRLGKVLRTWTVDVWARCEVTVDRIDGETTAANRGCRVKAKPLWWWW